MAAYPNCGTGTKVSLNLFSTKGDDCSNEDASARGKGVTPFAIQQQSRIDNKVQAEIDRAISGVDNAVSNLRRLRQRLGKDAYIPLETHLRTRALGWRALSA